MNTSHILRTALLLAAVAALSTGCKTFRKNKGEDAPTFDPEGTELIGEGGYLDEGQLALADTNFATLPPVEKPGYIQPVYFAYNDSTVPASEASKVSVVAQFLQQNGTVVVIVEGNCDERGTDEYNISLGEYRAQAVRERLVSEGVAANRIQTVSNGEQNPVDPGHNESAWSRNRRAELSFYQGR